MTFGKILGCVLVCGLIAGCGSAKKPERKSTFKVHGSVTVDGQTPTGPIQVTCHDSKGMDSKHPTSSQSMTDDAGKFEIFTYDAKDGVPPGDYVITFYHGTFNLMTREYAGKDQLKDRYRDPKKSEVKFTVTDKPVDLGEIKLKTK